MKVTGSVEIISELNRVYEIDVSFTTYIDKNYGADADGNRGVERSFIEDLEIFAIRRTWLELVNNDPYSGWKQIRLGLVPKKTISDLESYIMEHNGEII